MAHVVRGRSSKGGNYSIVLRNPAEKGKRFARQLRAGCVTETGEVLSPTDKAWRAGYLSARSDNAKAFSAKHGRKSKSIKKKTFKKR